MPRTKGGSSPRRVNVQPPMSALHSPKKSNKGPERKYNEHQEKFSSKKIPERETANKSKPAR